MISPVEQMRAKYKKRRKEAGTREDSTMAKLAMFTSTIRTVKKRTEEEGKEEEKVRTPHRESHVHALFSYRALLTPV